MSFWPGCYKWILESARDGAPGFTFCPDAATAKAFDAAMHDGLIVPQEKTFVLTTKGRDALASLEKKP